MRGSSIGWLCVATWALSGLISGCAKSSGGPAAMPTVRVERQDVEVTASADGVVEPIRTVEVKSKSSGEIIAMNVDTGDAVSEGMVLLQLLPKDAQNLFDQAEADLEAAQASFDNAQVQLARAQALFDDGLVAASELDIAQLAATSARTQVVRASKSLDNAAERLAETTVRSPISGTVIGKSVEVGQVVSSAVSQVSGGTLLLTLADLEEVQVRSLVDEVDIGKIHSGLEVTIQVEAFPERRFRGRVFKVEPQAVVEQNVTMFPVLTRIDNSDGLLKPGMNAEVEVLIERRDQVLALPNEALKTPQEGRTIAGLLGLGDGGAPLGARPAGGGAASGPATETAAAGDDRERVGADGRRERGPADRMVVFLARDGSYSLQPVRVGLRNWETTEIVDGVEDGQEVAVLPSASQLRQSQEFRDRMQRARSMPGMSSSSSSTSRSRGGS